MYKLSFILISLFISGQIFAQNVGINSTGASPDASAILDVVSTDQGVLVPRVDITDLTTAVPVTSPAISLLVYNTNATSGPGFFYWDGTEWKTVGGANEINDLTDGKTNGTNSVYLGINSGLNATGVYNVALGLESMQNTTGSFNSAVGIQSLKDITSGQANVAFGGDALSALITGSYNVAVGGNAGIGNQYGDGNIMIGYSAGSSANGDSNIAIGYNLDVLNPIGNRQMNIGDIIYGTNIYDTIGRIGIGFRRSVPDTSAVLDVASTTAGLLIPRMTLVQRDAIALPATSLMLYQTDNTPGFYYNSGTPAAPVWMTVGGSTGSTDQFYLGQDTLGGIVYYIYKDATGTQHGLIVNKNHLLNAIIQDPAVLNGNDRTEDGVFNTALIPSGGFGNVKPYITALADGGFTDWYLPAIDELVLLYHNRFLVNKALRADGFTLLPLTGLTKDTQYWSSTELNATKQYFTRFESGLSETQIKFNQKAARAVRAF